MDVLPVAHPRRPTVGLRGGFPADNHRADDKHRRTGGSAEVIEDINHGEYVEMTSEPVMMGGQTGTDTASRDGSGSSREGGASMETYNHTSGVSEGVRIK